MHGQEILLTFGTSCTVYEKISIDPTGPSKTLKRHTLQMTIDYYSHYPEAYILSNANSAEIISYLTKFFTCFGIPQAVISDNRLVFAYKEFENFLFISNYSHTQL